MSPRICIVGALLLAVAVDVARSASILHRTCRVPVLDKHRSYHISAVGARSSMDPVYVCLEYKDLEPAGATEGGTSHLVAMKCEITEDHMPMLVMDRLGVATCRAQIDARDGKLQEQACSLGHSDGKTTHGDGGEGGEGSRSLRLMRLTGQDSAVAESRLDHLFVTHQSVLCTQSYGDSGHAVPVAEAHVCRRGAFSTKMHGATLEVPANHTCSKIIVRTPDH